MPIPKGRGPLDGAGAIKRLFSAGHNGENSRAILCKIGIGFTFTSNIRNAVPRQQDTDSPPVDPVLVARAAGLRHSTDSHPGIRLVFYSYARNPYK